MRTKIYAFVVILMFMFLFLGHFLGIKFPYILLLVKQKEPHKVHSVFYLIFKKRIM